MGAAGAGKTRVGRRLAGVLGWAYYEGDDFHPAANVEKMRRGLPLGDEDRAPWLAALARLTSELARNGTDAVLACSALKRAYREQLRPPEAPDAVRFVYLRAPAKVLASRLRNREGHFMPATLVPSQLATLEEPAAEEHALILDATLAVDELVERVRGWLKR